LAISTPAAVPKLKANALQNENPQAFLAAEKLVRRSAWNPPTAPEKW
jgi:hypothetical protein